MRTLAILLNGCFYFGILGEAIEVNIDAFTSARMSSFVKHKWHYLEASKLMVLNASDFADCAMECLKLFPTCLSLNMASSPDEEKIFWCELLLGDLYNNSVNLRENALCHQYSKLGKSTTNWKRAEPQRGLKSDSVQIKSVLPFPFHSTELS